MPALTRSETRPTSAARQGPVAVFMNLFRGHPANVDDWGTARSPAAQAATLELFEAVAVCDATALGQALNRGACVNARLSDLLERQVTGSNVPPLRTPLDLAWWRQTHTDDGDEVYGNTYSDDPVRNLGLVGALLDAGATPDARWLRRLRGEAWDVDHHPAFEATVNAVLDRMGATALTDPWPQGVTLVPDTRSALQASDRIAYAIKGEPAELWVHRAVRHGHWPAFHAWFDRGGAVGVLGSEGTMAMLWDATQHRAPPQRGPFVDQAAVVAAIERAQAPLMRAPSAVYRQEMMAVMHRLARPLATAMATDRDSSGMVAPYQHEASHRCLAWVVDRLTERPLASLMPTEEEREPMRAEAPFVTELGRAIERLLLQRAAHETRPDAPSERARPRL